MKIRIAQISSRLREIADAPSMATLRERHRDAVEAMKEHGERQLHLAV